MESLVFLVWKRYGNIKSGTVVNGSTQRSYIDREDEASPTAASDYIIITGVIEAKQGRDVMINDVPNDFVKRPVPQDEGDEIIIMEIQVSMVDIICEISPGIYKPCVRFDKRSGEKILYVRILKALYGMIIASLLYYNTFRKDIESIVFEVNPYDACVANIMVNGKQHTVAWHFGDLNSSHVDPKVKNDFHEWLEKKYRSDDIGHVEASRVKLYDNLAITLDYTEEGKLKIDMSESLWKHG